MNDRDTRLIELKGLVADFVAQRRWNQFHTPKNLAMALAIEAAELMEHFQWLTPDESRAIGQRPDECADVADELADIVCYALAFANELDIDVAAAVAGKMQKNRAKYPASEYRGRFGPKDDRPVAPE